MTKVLFTVIIIVIKQSKDDGILCVCLRLSSLFLFEGNLTLNCMCAYACMHVMVSVCLQTHLRLCVFVQLRDKSADR